MCLCFKFFSFVDKSRLLPKTVVWRIHCWCNNYIIITSTTTERHLTRKIQSFSLRYLGFTALCTPKSNLHLFLRCGFHAFVLHKGFCFSMIDISLQKPIRGSNTIVLCDWLEGLSIPRKAKDRNDTRLFDTKGHFFVILKKTWISQLYFTIFAKKCLVRCVRTCSQILNNSPVCTVFAWNV